MPKYSVTIVETVVMTHKVITIDAPTEAAAIDQAEAMRCDGELDDPEHELVTEVAFKAVPFQANGAMSRARDPRFILTEMGKAAIAAERPAGA